MLILQRARFIIFPLIIQNTKQLWNKPDVCHIFIYWNSINSRKNYDWKHDATFKNKESSSEFNLNANPLIWTRAQLYLSMYKNVQSLLVLYRLQIYLFKLLNYCSSKFTLYSKMPWPNKSTNRIIHGTHCAYLVLISSFVWKYDLLYYTAYVRFKTSKIKGTLANWPIDRYSFSILTLCCTFKLIYSPNISCVFITVIKKLIAKNNFQKEFHYISFMRFITIKYN